MNRPPSADETTYITFSMTPGFVNSNAAMREYERETYCRARFNANANRRASYRYSPSISALHYTAPYPLTPPATLINPKPKPIIGACLAERLNGIPCWIHN